MFLAFFTEKPPEINQQAQKAEIYFRKSKEVTPNKSKKQGRSGECTLGIFFSLG